MPNACPIGENRITVYPQGDFPGFILRHLHEEKILLILSMSFDAHCKTASLTFIHI